MFDQRLGTVLFQNANKPDAHDSHLSEGTLKTETFITEFAHNPKNDVLSLLVILR